MFDCHSSAFQPSILSGLSHELRTPLVGIFGMAYFLSQTALSNEQKKYLHGILSSAEQLRSLGDNLDSMFLS
jgi:signal transduction histidine kinase